MARASAGTEDANGRAAARLLRPRSFMHRLTGRIIKTVIVVGFIAISLPFLLAALYTWEAVHPVSTLMAWRAMKGEKVERTWVELEEVSPFVWQSVLMSEDGQFCRHDGVDWGQVKVVVDGAREGKKVRGASTIPMQTVKNLFLWNSRSYLRKALEIPLALLVDRMWDKRRLMELYLNIAEWGPGIYGIEAAARHHFKRSARQLNRRQAGLLAASLPNPIERNPARPRPGLRRLGKRIEQKARRSGAYVKCLSR